jgi:hypothetical protein
MAPRLTAWAVALAVLLGGVRSPAAATGADPRTAAVRAAGLPRVRWTADRAVLNLGLDARANLTLGIEGLDAAFAVPGRVRASVGTVGPFAADPTSPGTFRTVYRAPAEIRPQAAILAVEVLLPGGRRTYAVTCLRLDAPTQFPLRTSPDARVTIDIAGRIFGPVVADSTGQVFVPIVVPPGVASGTARAVNPFGVAKETPVDLQSTDFQRIVVLGDPAGTVGGELAAEVWAVDPTGAPAGPEDMDLGAPSGTVRRLGGEPGHARFSISLPRLLGSGKMSLIASMNDGSSSDVTSVALRPGPPVRMVLSADPEHLVVGSGTYASATAVIRDDFGNPVEPRGLTVRVNGEPFPVQVAPDVGVVYIGAPAEWPAAEPSGAAQDRLRDRLPDRLVIRADLGDLHETAAIWLSGGAPASAELVSDRAGIVDGVGSGEAAAELLLRVRDSGGAPAWADHVDWQAPEQGRLEVLPSPHLGDYRARYHPPRALRNREATVSATVDGRLSSTIRVAVEAVPARTVTARVGILTNLSTTFGPSVFLDALWPLPRLAGSGSGGAGVGGAGIGGIVGGLLRGMAAGLSIGYLHSELNTQSAATLGDGVHVDLNQFPVLAIARVRVPVETWAEVFLSAMAGWTLARTTITGSQGIGLPISTATAGATTVGLGAEATLPLDPGQLVFGARYLSATLGKTSEGDHLNSNSLGLICDLGFKLGF